MTDRIRRSSRGRRWRRFKRAVRAHPRRVAAIGAVAVVALFGLWIGWRVFTVSQDLGDVEREAQIMRAALVRGDAPGAAKALERFRDAAESAEAGTSGPTWSLIENTPLFGDDARGVATVAEVLADIGRDGLGPVLGAAEEVTANAFRPADGRFPLDRIAALAGPAQESEAVFDDAVDRLAKVDVDGFVGPLHRRFDGLETLVKNARATLGSTYRAARLMPMLMGANGTRNYLLVLQNNAELRSGGGLPGAVSLVRMRDGQVDIVEQADMSELANTREPVVELTPEEERLFGSILAWAPVDATLTPDFARSSQIIRARWKKAKGTEVDGVFYVDPVAVAYLLKGVGSVDVPRYQPVNANNVIQAVENQVYLSTSDPKQHSAYQRAVAQAVFDAFASGAGDTAASIRGLVQGVSEGRIRMHSFRPEEQSEIAGTAIAGGFTDEPTDRAEVGIYINDAGPTKMQYYLNYDANVVARSCEDGRQEIGGAIEFHSNTPDDVDSLPPTITGEGLANQRVDPGNQLLILYVTSPVGGEVLELSLDDQVVANPTVERLAGRQVVRVGVLLEPQSRHTVEFVMRSGAGQSGPVELAVTPGAHPGSPNGTFRSACSTR